VAASRQSSVSRGPCPLLAVCLCLASSGCGELAGAVDGGRGERTRGIDDSIWQLQLPTGSGTSPMIVSPAELMAGFSNAYFHAADDGGQIFMDPATGITTSGSLHGRTEMREMTRGGQPAAWASSGKNTLTVSGKVVRVGGGANGSVTVGQIFDGTHSIPLCELEYAAKIGGFQLLYEETKGGGSTTNLGVPVALNTRYTFELALSNGVLTVAIDGLVAYTKTPTAAVAATSFYFKFGDYDQTASAGKITTAPYTIVEAYAADVVHE
jgi:hypothetical protein